MINAPFDSSKDYFAILGIHPEASDGIIKQAYRKMARRYHPDVSKIHNATQKFQEVSEAFEVLTKHKEAYWKAFCRLNQTRPHNVRGDSFKKHSRHQTKASSSGAYHRQPIRGKDRVITYPLTLRYAIRLLKLGYFYIPGLKVRMKFTREAFSGKTFRIKSKGYPGLYGGENGDYLVKFNLKMTGMKWELRGPDIYGTIDVPRPMLTEGNRLELESPAGLMKLTVPVNYSPKEYIRVENMGLPGDEMNRPGHLYARLNAA